MCWPLPTVPLWTLRCELLVGLLLSHVPFICYEIHVGTAMDMCVCVCICLKMKWSDLGAQILLLLIVIFWGTDNEFPPLWKWGTNIVDTLAWFLWLTWAKICNSRTMMKVSFASCSPILESLLPHSRGDVPGVEPKWPGMVWGWYFLVHELLCEWDTTASVTDQGQVELRLGKEILHFPLILFF